MRFKRYAFHLLLVGYLAAVVACARQPEPSTVVPAGDLAFRGQIAGFLIGLFHGFTMVLNMLASLIFDVRIYTFPNSGRLYDLGYVLGAAGFFGAASESRSKDRLRHR